jgi:hypothetical protein
MRRLCACVVAFAHLLSAPVFVPRGRGVMRPQSSSIQRIAPGFRFQNALCTCGPALQLEESHNEDGFKNEK